MKNRILIVFLLSISIGVNAQIFTKEAFEVANDKWAIGIGGGILNDKDMYGDRVGVFAANVTVKGFYGDFVMNYYNDHKNDVGVSKWKDNRNFAWHVGYQLPIIDRLRIIPVVGLHLVDEIHTDGSNYTIEHGYIENSSYSTNMERKFDFGGIVVYNIKHFNIYAAYTHACLYGLIGYQF